MRASSGADQSAASTSMRAAGWLLLEQGEQRLGEDRVADPGRSDDENLHWRRTGALRKT
jgi:hypothetical protein